MGNNTWVNSNVPVQVPTLSNIIAIAAGGFHTLALKNDGTVFAFGCGTDGQLGNGGWANVNYPAEVSNITEITSISAGKYHSLALKNDGTLWSWGREQGNLEMVAGVIHFFQYRS